MGKSKDSLCVCSEPVPEKCRPCVCIHAVATSAFKYFVLYDFASLWSKSSLFPLGFAFSVSGLSSCFVSQSLSWLLLMGCLGNAAEDLHRCCEEGKVKEVHMYLGNLRYSHLQEFIPTDLANWNLSSAQINYTLTKFCQSLARLAQMQQWLARSS